MEINKDFVLTLKKDNQTNQLLLSNIPIENPYIEELTNLKAVYNKPKHQGSEIYDTLQRGNLINVLRGWNYAHYMSSPNGYLEPDPSQIKFSMTGASRSSKSVIEQVENYVTASNLTQQLSQVKTTPEVLAYSHRYLGWTYITNKLNENFTLLHRTNFGYGSVSHFYTILTYRDIDLVSLSDWIIYRFVERSELIRYSAKHQLCNEGWQHAMEYAAKAWNMMVSNETEFVNTYIIGECEKMVKGIELFMAQSRFSLISGNPGYRGLSQYKLSSVEFSGPSLELIRAEKISGALTLIEKIRELEHITRVVGYIARIEYCNRKMMEKLPSTIVSLDLSIDKNKVKMIDLEKVMENRLIKSNLRTDLFDKFYSSLTTEGKKDSKAYEARFNVSNPTLKTAYEDWLDARGKFESKRDEVIAEENIMRQLLVFQNEIVEYFDQKKS